MILNKLKLNWPYAIGEIMLIAIGVMIALLVDEWRVERAERVLEQEYIGRIEGDLHAAIENWNGHVGRLEMAIAFLEGLRSDNPEPIDAGNVAETWNAYMVSHWFSPPAIQSSAYEELLSTGQLSLIEDVSLRQDIADFYSSYVSIAEMAVPMTGQAYTRLSRAVFPHETYYAANVAREYDVNAIRSSFEQLRQHPDFETASNAQLINHYTNIQFIGMFRRQAEELLSRLESNALPADQAMN